MLYLQALHLALNERVDASRINTTGPGVLFWPVPTLIEGDRLGRLKLTFNGLAERDRQVFDALRERGIPVAVSMAGGYGTDIDATVAVHLRTVIEASRSAALWHGNRIAGRKCVHDSMKQSAA